MIGTTTTATKLLPPVLGAGAMLFGAVGGAVTENPWIGGTIAGGLMLLVWKLVDRFVPSSDSVGVEAKRQVIAEVAEIEQDVEKIKKLVGKSQSLVMAQSVGRSIELAASAVKAIEGAAGDRGDLRALAQQLAAALDENRRALALVESSLRRDSNWTSTGEHKKGG